MRQQAREEKKWNMALDGMAEQVANADDDVSLLRVINTPTRGIGKAALGLLQNFAAAHGISLFAALRRADEISALSSRARNAVKEFVSTVDHWNGAGSFMGASIAGSLRDLAERVITESGLESHYKAQAAKNIQFHEIAADTFTGAET